jgi:tetratricopeptide (TPR) repeat protein
MSLPNSSRLSGREEDHARMRKPLRTKSLGLALRAVGDLDGALEAFRRALADNPAQVDARNNLGVTLSDKGLLEEAAASYRQGSKEMPLRIFAQPRWDGEPPAGKTILMYAEQGLGGFDPVHSVCGGREEQRRESGLPA